MNLHQSSKRVASIVLTLSLAWVAAMETNDGNAKDEGLVVLGEGSEKLHVRLNVL
jgi:hypothetical protein